MRLAVVVNRFPTLSETFIFNKVLGLLNAGLDVTVLAHSRDNDASSFAAPLKQTYPGRVRLSLLANGVASVPLALARSVMLHPIPALDLLRQAIALYPNLSRSLRAWVMALPFVLEGFDLIHFEYSGLAVAYLDALPLLRPAKLLTSCRGAAEQITPLMHYGRAQKLEEVFAQLDAVHCVSADIQCIVERYGLHPEKAFINHPAIDVQQFTRCQPYPSKSQGPFRILSVGRLHWKKGLEFGLLAFAQLVQAGLDVQYQIIGGGEEEEKLRYLINAMGLSDRVVLSGCQPAQKVRQALEEADIFLLPSLSEGLSNAVLEAMAMEVPVVSTTAGGMQEAITDGQEGFLVPPMRPDLMAAKLKSLLDHPKIRVQLGRAGKERVRHHFDLNSQINCFVEQYNQLVHSNVT